jgi:outer membrane protein assembly factor BamB
MTMTRTNQLTSRRPLRLWPGVMIAIVVLLARYVVPLLAPEAELFQLPLALIGMVAGVLGSVAIAAWWVFFSRAPWSERLGALVLMVVAMVAARLLVHESIRGGHMGMMLVLYAPPVLGLALVVWAVATRHLQDGARRALLVVTILLAGGSFTLLRTDGVMGAGSQIAWRWTPTAEQRLLALANDEPGALPPTAVPLESPRGPVAAEAVVKPAAEPAASPGAKTAPASLVPVSTEPATPAPATTAPEPAMRERMVARVEWPGFRGPSRDSVITGVRLQTDWKVTPPVEIWRRPIGPGWSSFAVRGDLLYTQEQRGDDEIVASYRVSTGEPVWRHRDPVRFWESNGGAGPRATPTLDNDRVYAFGATGILNALDADTGQVVWSRDVASDTGRRVPDWGFASSPLVVDDLVIVAAAGTLAAYDLTTGNPRWTGPSYGGSYSSPHRATLDGVVQIVLLGGPGAISVAPADGTVLWTHAWTPGPIVQPAMTADGDILISALASTGGLGTRRLRVKNGSDGWSLEERWTSNGLKPYFNDFVVHKGHAFGFDGSILASIDLDDGSRKWKGGRYGNGQLVLLADQDLLLVLSEEGELALVSATPDQFRELARFPALEGKTWNHPVVIGDLLLVRNGQEMAAFRLALADRRDAGALTRQSGAGSGNRP